MRKMTKAYQLKPVKEPVKAFQFIKKGCSDKPWYPITEKELNNGQMFIQGWQKLGKRMRDSITDVPRLSDDWKAQDIKEAADKFSLEVAEGLLEGWGSQSLYHDQSLGLDYAKHEILNMAYFGRAYDDFTDKVHDVSQRFIKSLLRKGYHFEGAWLWHDNGELVGMTGLYENVWLSPLQHVEHLLKGIVHLRPVFNLISWDEILVKLISVHPRKKTLLNRYVSVKDRIKYLSTQKIADDFEQIFTWQQVFWPKEKPHESKLSCYRVH